MELWGGKGGKWCLVLTCIAIFQTCGGKWSCGLYVVLSCAAVRQFPLFCCAGLHSNNSCTATSLVSSWHSDRQLSSAMQ